MAAYFFDTSALVKHYHTEAGSSEIDQILDESGAFFAISRLTMAEMTSVFAKKVRTGEIIDRDFEVLRIRFFADIRSRFFKPIRILNTHFELAGELIARHGKTQQIHTLDAIQLSVALLLDESIRMDKFICADQRLCSIASLEGLSVLNPELS